MSDSGKAKAKELSERLAARSVDVGDDLRASEVTIDEMVDYVAILVDAWCSPDGHRENIIRALNLSPPALAAMFIECLCSMERDGVVKRQDIKDAIQMLLQASSLPASMRGTGQVVQ